MPDLRGGVFTRRDELTSCSARWGPVSSRDQGDVDLARLRSYMLDPTRLAIVALLSPTDWMEFGVVRERLALAQPALSKQAANLERTGHLTIRKGYVGKRPRTWLKLTPVGRAALATHLAALRRIAGDV